MMIEITCLYQLKSFNFPRMLKAPVLLDDHLLYVSEQNLARLRTPFSVINFNHFDLAGILLPC